MAGNPRTASDLKRSDDPKQEYSCTLSCLLFLGFAFLFANSCAAIYRSRDDPWSVAYILVSLLDLVALFYILRVFERTPRNSSQRGKLKAVVWFLTTLLTIMFSHRIGAIMPPPIAIVAWVMAAATILGGFYAFFFYKQTDGQIVGTNGEKKSLEERRPM